MGQFSKMTDKPESINLEVLRCKDCKRLVFAADDTRISHHKCSGQWTVVFAEKVVIPKITALSAKLVAAKSRIGELEQAMQELAGAVFGTIPDSEPDVYADYDRLCELEEHCNAALRVTDKAAQK